MTPAQALSEAKTGALRPIYLVLANEPHTANDVLRALRSAALIGAVPGLNEDQFDAGERKVDDVLSAARTLPMMAKRRLVTVRQIERWEPRANDIKDTPERGVVTDPFEKLLDYAKSPSPSTVLLLIGTGLDKRRRLMQAALRDGYVVVCEPLGRAELPGFVEQLARERSHALAPGVAELIAELAGPDLAPVADAVERLCLYAGPEQTITEEMVSACVVRLRTQTVWELTGAVARRDAGAALTALADVFDPSESVRLIGLLAWSTRQLVRFEAALRDGASPPEAAQRAGAPPFKARELEQQVKGLPRAALESWLARLCDMDRDLKGGSKLPARALLERGVLELCARSTESSAALKPRGRS
jgi:DNA polymerase-3 subunit delta